MFSQENSDFEDTGYWTEKFIQTVQSKPAIYDTSLPENSDRNVVASLWLEICEAMVPAWNEMNSSRKSLKVKEVQGKWRNLRTCFRRELHKQKSGPTGCPVRYRRRKYLYFDQLSFLLPTIKDRETFNDSKRTSKPQKDNNSESDEEPFETRFFDESSSMSQPQAYYSNPIEDPVRLSSPQPIPVPVPVPVPSPQRHPSVDVEHISPAQPTIKKAKYESDKQTIYKETNSKEEEFIDEDKTFLLSLVPTFKRLNSLQKFDAKIEFLQTLKRITQTKQQLHQSNGLTRRPNPESEYYEEKYNITDVRSNAC